MLTSTSDSVTLVIPGMSVVAMVVPSSGTGSVPAMTVSVVPSSVTAVIPGMVPVPFPETAVPVTSVPAMSVPATPVSAAVSTVASMRMPGAVVGGTTSFGK